MRGLFSRVVQGLLAGGVACSAAHADRPEFGAFLDLQQVAEGQLHGPGSDDVTYTEIAGNITGQINNRRITLSGSYRLSYRLPEAGNLDKSLNQDGLLRFDALVIDEWLNVSGGAIVTRSRIDPSGASPTSNVGNNGKNLAQTYSSYLQPSLAHRIGDLDLSATYRYAYTKNESSSEIFSGAPTVDRFDSSVAQTANAAIGMQRSSLPFDWTVGGEYRHENSTSLDQHFRGMNLTGEVKVPIARTVALVGSGGYEKTRISEREALIDPLTGAPVLGKGGRFVVDPASPRILTYEMSGLIADAGIIWRPSRRSRVEARAGYRYGGFSVTGLAELRPNDRTGMILIVSDRVETFGQAVSGGLAGSPANLNLGQSIDSGSSYQDCLFGKTAGTGQCIGGALGQAAASSYRQRAANVILTRAMRQWTISGSFGYSRRNYFDDPNSPVSLAGVVDQSFFGNLGVTTQLTRVSGVSFSFSGNLFKNGQVGASDVVSGSASANYFRSFGRSIGMQALVAVDASKQDGVTADVSGRAQLGLNYRF